MNTIEVVNIKCGGCANTIQKELEKLGAENISVDIENGKISFENGDISAITQKLEDLGYPEKNSEKAQSFLKKAKSFVSCGIGKFSKK